MNLSLSYQINGINGIYIMPIEANDTVKFISSNINSNFGIIQPLTAYINGKELNNKSRIADYIQEHEIVTFDISKKSSYDSELKLYRQPIIIPRYRSDDTFIVFTTINFQSMVFGNKITVDIEFDSFSQIQAKIKKMLLDTYKKQILTSKIKHMKILLFFPGGVPFLKGNINDFVQFFPDFMPHLYAIILYDKNITESVLNEEINLACDIKNINMRYLLSPDYNSDEYGLGLISAVLGYIQFKGPRIMQMIYSIAKFCPFPPLICSLYHLLCISRITGRIIVQITASLLTLFKYMSQDTYYHYNLFEKQHIFCQIS